MIENTNPEKVTAAAAETRKICWQADGAVIIERKDGSRYKMLPDGSYIFESKQN